MGFHTDETKQLVDNDLTGFTSTTDEGRQRLVEQNGDLVDIVAEGVDVVQQVQDGDDRADRGTLWQQVRDRRQQVHILTEGTQKIATIV